MKKDRSDWIVRKVTFAEAEQLDDEYYANLSGSERLEILMGLRTMINSTVNNIKPVVIKRNIHEFKEV